MPVVAGQDVPPFARAAMDGFAVIAQDTFGAGQFDPKVLSLVEKVFTGQVPHACSVGRASAARSPRAHRCPQVRTPS